MGAEAPTADELIRRARICLFELGYHDIEIVTMGRLSNGEPALATSFPIPPAVGYQVGLLDAEHRGRLAACYSCWLEGIVDGFVADDCREGRCHNPEGPARPPREELVGRV